MTKSLVKLYWDDIVDVYTFGATALGVYVYPPTLPITSTAMDIKLYSYSSKFKTNISKIAFAAYRICKYRVFGNGSYLAATLYMFSMLRLNDIQISYTKKQLEKLYALMSISHVYSTGYEIGNWLMERHDVAMRKRRKSRRTYRRSRGIF